jgi:PQQ-dependent catabolism-associated CXXCW motif protein
VSGPTPTNIPGGRIVTTAQMRHLLEVTRDGGLVYLLVDAWNDLTHPTLPGAVRLPFAGSPRDFDDGDFDDVVQGMLWDLLGRLTDLRADYPIVFFCAGARCWESYNAAFRAIRLGFENVFWYRGGTASWEAAGLPLVTRNRTNPPGFGRR